jgi:hypothetical protein
LREAVARLDDEFRRQAADQRRRRRRAEQHRFGDPARMQQSMGEDVAALGVGAELDLVDGEELDPAVERHRLDRAHPIARRQRHDLFFAGDQRDVARAARLDHAVVDLARQQPQRQADHAGRMAEHALDRQMRLASVGGAENGDEARGGRADRRVGHGVRWGRMRRSASGENCAGRGRKIPLPVNVVARAGEGQERGAGAIFRRDCLFSTACERILRRADAERTLRQAAAAILGLVKSRQRRRQVSSSPVKSCQVSSSLVKVFLTALAAISTPCLANR